MAMDTTVNSAMEGVVISMAQGHAFAMEQGRLGVLEGKVGYREGLTHRVTSTPSMLFGYTLEDGKTVRQNNRAVGVVTQAEIIRRLTRAQQARLDEMPVPDTSAVKEVIRK